MKSKSTGIFIALGAFIVIACALAFIVNNASKSVLKTMVCKNATGTLTIEYNEKEVTNYKITGTGVSFNMNEANLEIRGEKGKDGKYSGGVGIDTWLDTFSSSFINTQHGACQIR